MSNQYLKLRRSAIPGKVPETSSIDFGEIALNTYDGLAFIKKSGSLGEEIVTIGSGTSTNISGSNNFIPVFSGSNSLVTSSIYQSGSFTGIRDTSPLDSNNPDILLVQGAGVSTYNLISAHSDLNDFVQVNVQNFSQGGNSSADIVATKDDGTPSYGYVNMGINGSQYSNGAFVGNASDAYIYSLTNGNLLIGNAESGKEVIIFNGGIDASANSKIFIHDQGTIGINTSTYNTVNPPSLQIAPPNLTTYNLIQAKGQVDSYLQTAITNAGTAPNASADMVAYNDIDPINQLKGFMDVGINSTAFSDETNYPGWRGGDSYVYSDAPRLTIGGATSSAEINLYVGGVNPNLNSKLILRSSNIHSMTGSLRVTGSITALSFTGSLLGTSSYAITASYWSGSIVNATSASYAATAALAPAYVLNSSTSSMLLPYVLTSVTSSMTVLSASFAATTSLAPNYVLNSSTSSMLVPYVLTSVTASMLSPYVLSSNTGSFITNSQTSSMSVLSASFASTASSAPNYVLNSSTASMLSPYVLSSNTSSFITNSQTSSMSVLSASFASTASSAENFTVRGTLTAQTIVVQTITSSIDYVTGSTRFGSLLANTHQFTGSVSITGSLAVNGSSVIVTNQTSSMSVATASYVLNAVSSSYVGTASLAPAYVLTSVTSSMTVATASYVLNSISSSYAVTAALAPNYVLNSSTSSMLLPYVLTSITSSMSVATASYVLNSISASYSATTSLAPNYVLTSVTSSMSVATSSYAATSSLPLRGLITGSVAGATLTFTKGDGTTFDLTVAQSGTVSTASYVTSSGVYGPFGANSILTASYALTASYVANASSFPFTGSALITGSLTVTGSTNIQSLNLGASQFNNTSSVTSAGTTVISQLAIGSYTSCFYNYTIASASNARSGQVMSVWNGATVRYTEVTTTDIGNTATASFAVALSGANVQLNFTAPGVWTVKNISNLL